MFILRYHDVVIVVPLLLDHCLFFICIFIQKIFLLVDFSHYPFIHLMSFVYVLTLYRRSRSNSQQNKEDSDEQQETSLR